MRRRADANQGELSFASPMRWQDLQEARRQQAIELLRWMLCATVRVLDASGEAENER
jgi:hypothetical protein